MQGTIVDRIDYNIQNVATTVEEGLKQLQKVLFFVLQNDILFVFIVIVTICVPFLFSFSHE